MNGPSFRRNSMISTRAAIPHDVVTVRNRKKLPFVHVSCRTGAEGP